MRHAHFSSHGPSCSHGAYSMTSAMWSMPRIHAMRTLAGCAAKRTRVRTFLQGGGALAGGLAVDDAATLLARSQSEVRVVVFACLRLENAREPVLLHQNVVDLACDRRADGVGRTGQGQAAYDAGVRVRPRTTQGSGSGRVRCRGQGQAAYDAGVRVRPRTTQGSGSGRPSPGPSPPSPPSSPLPRPALAPPSLALAVAVAPPRPPPWPRSGPRCTAATA